MKEEALKLADDLEELHEQDLIDGVAHLSMPQASTMIRRLVEELDKKQQAIVEASGMLFNYKYELDLERAMSEKLREELEKVK